jgi:nucleotidyltransferase AbiEii toxin of type IV toxin-antitoxin system
VGLDPFQADVARIALEIAADHGFALAGGNALAAHGILHRRTEDVDLFSPKPGAAGAVADRVVAALERAGYEVHVIRPAQANQGEFARFVVTRGEHTMNLDLGRDWRQWPPVSLSIGPVLHVDDAVGSKVAAAVGRGLARDFVDVAAALDRYSRAELMRLAFLRDPGLQVADFANAVRRLDSLRPDDFAGYGLDETAVAELRKRFDAWPRDVADDQEGQAAYRAAADETGN